MHAVHPGMRSAAQPLQLYMSVILCSGIPMRKHGIICNDLRSGVMHWSKDQCIPLTSQLSRGESMDACLN